MRLEDYYGFQGQAGFTFGSDASTGISPNALFPQRRKDTVESRQMAPLAESTHDASGEHY